MRSHVFPLVLGFFLLGPALAAGGEAEGAGDVVAVVDGENVTRADLDAFIKENLRGRPASPAEKARVEKQALDALISRKLVRSFVDGQKIEVEPDLLFEAKLYSYLRSKIEGPRTEEEAVALAGKIKAELDGGAKFEDLAKKHSACPSAREGGDLKDFDPARMAPPFSQAVKALKVGEVSGPVKTQFGHHIIERLALTDPAGEARGALHARHILVQVVNSKDPRAAQAVLGKLIEDLRKKAKVENRLAPGGAVKE